jgi:methanogenic corrinoid protein MtbC1
MEMFKINRILVSKTDYMTFDEPSAEKLIDDLKEESLHEGYTLIGYSIQKKIKKEIEYYIIKTVKQYEVERELIEGMK